MRILCLTILAGALSTIVSPAAAPKCQNMSVKLTVSADDTFGVNGSVTSKLQADSGGSYVDSVNGVSAIINLCSGSNDMLLNFDKRSPRRLTADFASIVSPAPDAPAWAANGPVSITYMNIRNLFFNYNKDSSYSFTTRLVAELGGVASGYHFGLVSPFDDAWTAPTITPEMNEPITTSLVVVQHYPAGGIYGVETWVVYPSTEQMDQSTSNSFYVAGLTTTVGNRTVNAGQYSIPFQITIQPK